MKATRKLTAGLALGLIALVVAVDLGSGAVPNPYRAPPLVALGSGLAAGGAHCAALPRN
jgi:hypothetical protein